MCVCVHLCVVVHMEGGIELSLTENPPGDEDHIEKRERKPN